MHYYPGKLWYAIRIRSKFVEATKKSLESKNIPFLNLTYKVLSRRKDRKKVLTKAFFPGYMFVNSELNPETHVEILKSTGVIDLIKNSQGPLPIPENQIDNVSKLEQFEGKIMSLNNFTSGMAVRVVQGPLKGLEGYVDEVDRDLIRVGVESIPGSVAVQVKPYLIEPVENNESFSLLF